MTGLSTHILDTVRGVPAAGVSLRVNLPGAGEITRVTDADGRALLCSEILAAGSYRIVFAVGAYWRAQPVPPQAFYEEIPVQFSLAEPSPRLHVPLLLAHFGYTTYRGS